MRVRNCRSARWVVRTQLPLTLAVGRARVPLAAGWVRTDFPSRGVGARTQLPLGTVRWHDGVERTWARRGDVEAEVVAWCAQQELATWEAEHRAAACVISGEESKLVTQC